MSEFNYDLFEKAISFAYWSAQDVRLEPNISWKQNFWAQVNDCGTSFCIAGYVVHATGNTARLPQSEKHCPCCGHLVSAASRVIPTNLDKMLGSNWNGFDQCFADDYDTEWPLLGQKLLGIDDQEASSLFHAENTVDRIMALAHEITDARGLPEINVNRYRLRVVETVQDEVTSYTSELISA